MARSHKPPGNTAAILSFNAGQLRGIVEMLRRRQVEGVRMPRFTGTRWGRELNRELRARRQRELFFDFRKVPVFGHAVRPHALVALDEQKIQFGLPSRATDAAQRIRNDGARVDQTGARQRNGWQQDARGIAARRGDQRRALDGRAMNLRQAVNGLGQKLRRGMVVSVKFLVSSALLSRKSALKSITWQPRASSGTAKLRRHAMRQARKTTAPCWASSSTLVR